MLRDKLKDYRVVLASGSPRRKSLLKGLDIDFDVEVRPVDETFPPALKREEITDYLAKLKASAFENPADNEIIITADTIVWMNGRALNKPENADEALSMLQELSGKRHQVISSVCFSGSDFQRVVNECTNVWLAALSRDEIAYYIRKYRPFDKAGSYGIQEWIGLVGIEKLEGSYFNVVGLPTRLVYKTLMELGGSA
jgi:septum formation protein